MDSTQRSWLLAGRLYSLFGYEIKNFWEVNPRPQNGPSFMDYGIDHLFNRELSSRPTTDGAPQLTLAEWLSLKTEKSLQYIHLKASAMLAQKAHWIGRKRMDKHDGLCWSNLQSWNRENLQPNFLNWCHDAVATKSASKEEWEVDFSYSCVLGKVITYIHFSSCCRAVK
jgi:hypothetical protein